MKILVLKSDLIFRYAALKVNSILKTGIRSRVPLLHLRGLGGGMIDGLSRIRLRLRMNRIFDFLFEVAPTYLLSFS